MCATPAYAQRLDVLGGIPITVAEKVVLVLAPEDGPAVVWADGTEVPAAIWETPGYVDRWKLPNREEWNLIVEQAQPDWGLDGVLYWTAEEADAHYAYVYVMPMAAERPAGPEVRHKQQDAIVQLVRSVD